MALMLLTLTLMAQQATAPTATIDGKQCLRAERGYRPLTAVAPVVKVIPCAEATNVTKPAPAREVERYLAEYADCVVGRRDYRAKVQHFLRVVPGSAAFGPAGTAAADLTCLNDAAARSGAALTMRLQQATLRDALYPALYRREFGKTGPFAEITAAPPVSLSAEFDGKPDTLPADYRPRRALGDCVARAIPAGGHALLIAKPYTPAEDAAVAQLRPALGGCLGAGQTVRFTRAELRAYVGEALYKLTRAAVTARPGTDTSKANRSPA